MNNKKLTGMSLQKGRNSLLMISLLALSVGCHKTNVDNKELRDFSVVNLVDNNGEYQARGTDPTLINGFGIAWSPGGVAWVNSVGGHVSELYSSEGGQVRPGINIPAPHDSIGGLPCGIVFSGNKKFGIANGPAAFIFTGFDGVLSAWNAKSGNNAVRISGPHGPNDSYTGLAIGNSGGQDYIYGANFGAKKIDVWDTAFRPVAMSFKDPGIPSGYSPYNIQAVGNWLFVIYGELATSGPSKGHGIAGVGKGFVSVFNTDGSFVRRFASHGTLNLPWGVTMAAGTFLEDRDLDSGDGGHNNPYPQYASGSSSQSRRDPKDPVILVGNFGDGRIGVYSQDGRYLGLMQKHNRQPLEIEGLWALTFAPASATSIDPKRLYFSAGPDSEADGVFGYIIKK